MDADEPTSSTAAEDECLSLNRLWKSGPGLVRLHAILPMLRASGTQEKRRTGKPGRQILSGFGKQDDDESVTFNCCREAGCAEWHEEKTKNLPAVKIDRFKREFG